MSRGSIVQLEAWLNRSGISAFIPVAPGMGMAADEKRQAAEQPIQRQPEVSAVITPEPLSP
jgi:hypothetical protein